MPSNAKRVFGKISLIILAAGAVYIGFEVVTFPNVDRLKIENPKSTALMDQRDQEARLRGKRTRRLQIWVPLASISPNLINAVLIAEDAAFFQHEGLDYHEIREAIKVNAEKLEFARGASTITQQLAKNLYLSTSKNPVRKVKELFLTFALEGHLSKKRILELYLNLIEWGEGVYGAEAAARAYFGKSCNDLSDDEAAALAAVIINPRRYSPLEPSKRIRNRIALIRQRMERYSYYR
jgi:monofunctional biosynthetic peptidoglycan transglycosylase